ncbi:MAG: right-handed parallel beta-helix repeat-containing protein, partial [Thermorudis peleae]|nr:right-handed parallel beta-helix repeat-containing protein [Thermorudis peleae]
GAVADDPNDNVCSLVEAVTAATTNAAYHECPAGSATDPDTITLAAGTYTLTSPLPETFPSQDGGLVIAGAGLNATTVQYNNPQGDWLWAFGDITVTVQDLTLDGGANSPGLQPTGATFTLRNARLQHFGMALLIGPSGGTVTVQNTRFTQNGPSAFDEGAIGIDNNEPATLIVQNSQFDGNQAGSGGAIWVWPSGGTSATVQITGSTFTQNQGLAADTNILCFFAGGGAIWINPTSHAQVTVDQSTFQGNTTAGYGGAISGPVTVTNSTFSQNHADKEGGALALVTHYSASGSIQVSGSTFTDNTADEGGAIFLGGCSDASLSMVNSTISHNTVSNGEGSAIYLSGPNSQASLAFVTLADNSGPTALDVGEAPHGTFRLKNVVLADPNVPECGPLDNGSGTGLTVQTAGAVLADDASCGSGVSVVPNLRSTLGSLTSNGGPTPTHALLNGSPAIA